MIKHVPVDATEPQKEYTIGSVGTEVSMANDEDVRTSLRVWDQEAIDLIQSEKLRELSSGYAYRADMTPGEYKGVKYDGIMRDIHGNHVALVERGRIGRDAIIADSLPKLMEQSMTLKKGTMTKVGAMIKAKLGLDADISAEALKDIIEEVAGSIEPAVEETKEGLELKDELDDDNDDDDEEIKTKTAEDEDNGEKAEKERKKLEQTDRDDRDAKRDEKKAMDADSIRNQVRLEIDALYAAREAVKPLIGKVACDSAEQVYKMALDHAGVDTKGVHPSAFKAMAQLVIKSKKSASPAIAVDSDIYDDETNTLLGHIK